MKTTKRPWGSYTLIYEKQGYWVKKIKVNPGASLSLQYHLYRKEKWTIVKGYGLMTLEKSKFTVFEGDQISIPYLAQHRITNLSEKANLIFIEVALGQPNENDIIRIEDNYGRV